MRDVPVGPLPTEAEISRALAAAVKQGLRVISYRAVPGAVLNHSESRIAAYITNGGALEVWSSPRGTWTMTQTRPDGLTCIVATGRGAYAFPLPVDGEPA